MRHFSLVMLLLMGWLLSACNLTTQRVTQEPVITGTPAAAGRPTVTISSPASGDEAVVGSDIFVAATASDSVGITSVRLLANNQIVKTVSSQAAGGDRSMNVLLDYRPTTTGPVNLDVIAFRGSVASEPARISITVRASQAQVTATIAPPTGGPIIDPNDPTCRALINVGLNVRTGPGVSFPRIRVLEAGTVVPIIGRIADNSWWQVRLSGTSNGWVIQSDPANPQQNFIRIYGVCTGVPIVNIPAPITATPTFIPTWTSVPPVIITATSPPPPPPPTVTPGLPDLIVNNISGPTTLEIPPGETSITQQYVVTILNVGGSPTGQFNNTIGIVGQPFIELGTVASLGANQAITLTADLTFTAAGSYVVRAIIDSDSQVPELSEVNNRGEIDVTVTGP